MVHNPGAFWLGVLFEESWPDLTYPAFILAGTGLLAGLASLKYRDAWRSLAGKWFTLPKTLPAT